MNNTEFLKNVQAMLGWGYVLGGQGEFYTKELAEKWGNAGYAGKSKTYFTKTCAKWIGNHVVDCSGMIIEAIRKESPQYTDQTANDLYAGCTSKGAIASIPEIPGLCVWRKGHIGVYKGDGVVIESGGTSKGVVESKLDDPATGKNWTNWGKLAAVTYADVEVAATEEATSTNEAAGLQLGRLLSYKCTVKSALNFRATPSTADKPMGVFRAGDVLTVTGAVSGDWVPVYANGKSGWVHKDYIKYSTMLSGEDVKDLQEALKESGSNPGTIDGVFGQQTAQAVTDAQKQKNITADGVVGKKTTEVLGGVYEGK